MTAVARYLILILLLLAGAGAASQPLRYESDRLSDGPTETHLLLPSAFLGSLCETSLQFARIRNLSANYDQAVAAGDYELALSYADSMITISKNHSIRGVYFTQCYEDRAQMLEALHRDEEACTAYDHAVRIRNSVMHIRQNQELREMQASYELDRLSLDKALLTARHHRLATIASALLLAAIALVVGFIYTANRRTKRLQQELLLRREQARQSEEKKTAFIDSICHEVRTPLNSITGFAELLCSEETTPEARTQYCEIIQQSRRQLRYLFDDMLEVAFLENLHEPLPHRYIDLCTLCRTQLRVMKVKFPKPGVVYTSRIPAADIGLNTNDKYLGLLVAILLNNAYKFTQKGSITLECDRKDEGHVFIAVADTGCGIPADKYDYVFERFTKLDKFSQGNGLGLYLCRLIVTHLHGEVHIDPEYANGTRIVATLPRK